MIRNSSLSLFLAVIIVASCNGRDVSDGQFTTSYKIGDSVSLYDLGIFARLNGAPGMDRLSLRVEVITPSGKSYIDTLSLLLSETDIVEKMVRERKWTDILWYYRSGVSFPYSGKWQFVIEQTGVVGNSNLRDAGVVVRKKKG